MYSHDTFGLGHLRRCRAIAHSIVERFKGVSVLIVSGSQIAGAFDFRARVDFVKIPSVIKLYNGEYDSIGEYIAVDEILEMRKLIIQRTAETFQPDIFIVDKEPCGLKGELVPTLEMFNSMPTQTVLGLRDVMDSPELLRREWDKQNMIEKIETYYDNVWVYGPRDFWNPLEGFDLSENMQDKIRYTGFLDREYSGAGANEVQTLPDDYILVTAGGGGDGSVMMEQVLAALEHDPLYEYPVVMVLGPFMKYENRERIRWRASHLSNVTVLDFENRMELLMQDAAAVVGMCGYNTFCEVLSYDKRALFIPRTAPRQEQFIRAKRAREMGLCELLTPEEASVPKVMAEMLRKLPDMDKPSKHLKPDDMKGLDNICSEISRLSKIVRNETDAPELATVLGNG